MRRGLFISFEGGEGCGKSTQASLLKTSIENAGHKVILTREPGGTWLGEQVRHLIKDQSDDVLRTLHTRSGCEKYLPKTPLTGRSKGSSPLPPQ